MLAYCYRSNKFKRRRPKIAIKHSEAQGVASCWLIHTQPCHLKFHYSYVKSQNLSKYYICANYFNKYTLNHTKN